jgi:hypothetical protein
MGMLSLGAELQDLGRPEEGTGMGRTYGMRSGTLAFMGLPCLADSL